MSASPRIVISIADSATDIEHARLLFEEYAAWLGFSLDFQQFEKELATLPGKYAPPAGRLLLARCDGAIAGCGALRALHQNTCEMKRVYVRDGFRGLRLGLTLVQRLIDEARIIGYEFMRLDTIPEKMADAHRLYRSLGFYEIPAYYDGNPQPHVCYMELPLRSQL